MATPEPYYTLSEILAQPATWRAVLREIPEQARALAEAWKPADRAEAFFVGCGSPYYLARTAAGLFQSAVGLPGRADPASDWMFFPDTIRAVSRRPLLVVFSRSGETTEIVNAVEKYRAQYPDGIAIGIICRSGTTLERLVTHTLLVPDALEISLAQTRSFTGMLATGQTLIAALAGQTLSQRFFDLPEHGEAVIAQAAPIAQALGEDVSLDKVFFLGSGPYYGLACEAMLKMKEVSLSTAESYHFMEFRHGPMALIDQRSLVVGLVSEAALAQDVAVLTQMRAIGARVLALTPTPLARDLVDHQVVLPGGLTDGERGPLYLPAPQLLAYHRAVVKGIHPDQPQNLSAFVSLNLAEIENRAVRGVA